MRRRRFGVALFGAVLRLAVAGRAIAAETASAFIQAVGRELPGIVAGASGQAEKRERLKPFLRRVVDVERVGRFCLGRHWRAATPAQRIAYQRAFLDAVATAVAARTDSYAGDAKISFLPETAEPEGVSVRTVVQNGAQPAVRVTWLVDTTTSPYRILDVTAEGISMRLALRSDYGGFLESHGGDMDLFLRTLREHGGG